MERNLLENGPPRTVFSPNLDPAWSNYSCSFLIAAFEQGAGPFPTSNGHVTWIIVRCLRLHRLSFRKTGSGSHTVRLGRDGDRLSERLAIASSTFHHRGDDNRGIGGSVNRIDAKEARRRQSDTQSAVTRRYRQLGSQPFVTMVKTANLWKGDHVTCFDELARPWHRTVLTQR
jgi:hypothetical protein